VEALFTKTAAFPAKTSPFSTQSLILITILPVMSSEKNILIEFPADRDYIPFIQVFLKDFLKDFEFGEEFSKKAATESLLWLNAVIPNEKFLHALPIVSFNCKYSEKGIEVEIQTTDEKTFTASLDRQLTEKTA
jgi:hypothetical protein